MISTVVAKGILFAFSTTYPLAKPPNRPTMKASVWRSAWTFSRDFLYRRGLAFALAARKGIIAKSLPQILYL